VAAGDENVRQCVTKMRLKHDCIFDVYFILLKDLAISFQNVVKDIVLYYTYPLLKTINNPSIKFPVENCRRIFLQKLYFYPRIDSKYTQTTCFLLHRTS